MKLKIKMQVERVIVEYSNIIEVEVESTDGVSPDDDLEAQRSIEEMLDDNAIEFVEFEDKYTIDRPEEFNTQY